MKVIDTPLEGLKIIEPQVFTDHRGLFFESFNSVVFEKHFGAIQFFQDNQSISHKNVLRGLHFQNPPFGQVKLVRVAKGCIWDVAVDIRKKSPTFGQHFKIELSAANHTMLWIPEGFAHGFVAREDDTILLYKCSAPYHKASEGCLTYNDPALGIDWGTASPIVSEKDLLGSELSNLNSLF